MSKALNRLKMMVSEIQALQPEPQGTVLRPLAPSPASASISEPIGAVSSLPDPAPMVAKMVTDPEPARTPDPLPQPSLPSLIRVQVPEGNGVRLQFEGTMEHIDVMTTSTNVIVRLSDGKTLSLPLPESDPGCDKVAK